MADLVCRGCAEEVAPEDVVQGGHVVEVTRTRMGHAPGCFGECDRAGCPIPEPYPDLELCGPVEPDPDKEQQMQTPEHPNAYQAYVGEEMSALANEGIRRLTETVELIAVPLDITQVTIHTEVTVVHRDGSTSICDGVVLAVWRSPRQRVRDDDDLCAEPLAGSSWIDGEPHVCGLPWDDHGDEHVSILDASVRWPDGEGPGEDSEEGGQDVAGDEPF